MSNVRNKLNVQFNERQAQSIETMASQMATTKAGVIKTALALLEVALRERRSGNNLAVIRDDKIVKEIVGFD